MLPDKAVMVVVPARDEVTNPLEPAMLLIVATVVSEELHVTEVVRSCFVPFEYVPVAVSCLVFPESMPGFTGVISRDAIVSGVTVKVVEPEMLPDEALMVVLPVATAVANPVLSIVAKVEGEEAQPTDVVMFRVVLSEYVPVAVNCSVVPRGMLGLAGVTAIEISVALDVLAPPPPPPQLVNSKRTGIRKSSLFNFIDAYSLRYQSRRVGAPLQVTHMSPFLHNDTVCFYRDVPAARLPVSMSQGFLILRRIGSKERRQIGMSQSVPGDTEDDT
jgi:hypothetical protein